MYNFGAEIFIGSCIFCAVSINVPGQTNPQDAATAVERIMSEALKRGVTVLPGGIVATTFTPASDQDNAGIRQLGDASIKPLSEYLNSEEPRAHVHNCLPFVSLGSLEVQTSFPLFKSLFSINGRLL